MLKSDACAIVARRLALQSGRVKHLVQRASEAGLLPTARGSDRPELGAFELARLLLAAICDRGLGHTAASVSEFANLSTSNGAVLADLLEAMIAGIVPIAGLRSMVVQLEPAGVALAASEYFRFGAEHTEGATKQVVIRGSDLAAAILEFRGLTPREADESIAVGRLAAALH